MYYYYYYYEEQSIKRLRATLTFYFKLKLMSYFQQLVSCYHSLLFSCSLTDS